MSKLYQNLFTILVTFPFLTCSKFHKTEYVGTQGVVCVDCKKTTGDECLIRSTGYKCFSAKKNKEEWNAYDNFSDFDDDPPESYDLDDCIPRSLDIKAVMNYCCVWSPKLGCQYLRGYRVSKTALECVSCTIHDLDYPDQPVCPCVRESGCQMCVSALLLVVGVILVL